MPKLFEIRYNDEKKYYEMLIAISTVEELWVPAATHWIHYRIPFSAFSALRDMTLYEMLIMEGWTAPEL